MDEGPIEALFDVTIIGGGPVGLFGSFYAGMRGMKAKIVDSLTEFGGQLAALYPEKYIFDMPGFPRVVSRDLVNEMAEQGLRFAPTVALGERVDALETLPDGNLRLVTNKATHLSKTVIVCAGAGAFTPKRLAIPGIEEMEGCGVHYFVQNKKQFEGNDLLIVGGGDS